MTKIIWLCHGATAAMRKGAFPAPGDAIDDGGAQKIAKLDLRDLKHDHAVTSPSRAAVETAQALGLLAVEEAAIRDIGLGRWTGTSFEAAASSEGKAISAWFADPAITPPDGEPLADVADRINGWMDAQRETGSCVLAIAQPMVIRMAIAHALQCSLPSACKIDIAPLSRTSMSFNGKWRLQELTRAHD
jgi:broad specificity phosphatase PhoE